MEHAPSHSTAILSGGTPEHAPVINAAEKAFQRVFKKGYKPDDLFKTKEFADLVTETKAAFDPAIKFVQSDVLKSYLDQDAFIFSGLKTHRQLTQARSLLKDGKGNIRPYHQFEQEITKLNNTYNKLYLEAEYEFAVQSAQSADQWSNLSDDTERYWLQYRTAQDERVREDHAALAGTTLPKDDPFWDSYYPPNGWRCRCVAVEVLARKNKRSDSKEAIKKGEKATTQINKSGTNKLAMFRFNPGKQQKLFPPKNSYMPRGCGGTLSITDAVFLALDDEACRAMKIIEERAEKNIEVWENIKTENGKVRVSSLHGKIERAENIEIASYFSNKYGHEIDLIARSHIRKSPDVYNKTLKTHQEYKSNNTPTKSAIDNAIKDGAKKANHIVISIKSDITDGDLRDSIKDRVRRCKNLEKLTIIKGNIDKTYSKSAILKDDWVL